MKTFKGSVLKVFFTSLLLVVSFVISINSSLAYEKEVGRLSGIMIDKIGNSDKHLIAVVDFSNLAGNITELGRFLAEEFSCALSNNKRGFEMIERNQLKNILEEHKLSLSGIIDRKTAQKIGEISGIEALVTGTITSLGEDVRLTVKLLDTETAKIISSTRGHIPKTRAIGDLWKKDIEPPGPPSGRPKVRPNTQPRKGKSFEAQGLTFTPLGCERRGSKTVCAISLTNNGSEVRKLYFLSDNCFFVDNDGNKYRVKVSIGGEGAGESHVGGAFLPQVPTNVVFFAKDVSPKATSVTVAIYEANFKNDIVGVRDIPITN